MEVSAFTYEPSKSGSHTKPVTYNDVLNSYKNNTLNNKLSELLGIKDNKTESNSKYIPDALEAVKLDPAVLEAQITVDRRQKDSTPQATAIDSSVQDEVSVKEDDPSQSKKSFEELVSMQEAALLSLTPQQLEFLMKYTEVLRRKRSAVQKYSECAFCKNNGESVSWYTAHKLKDGRGRVRCPVLRGFRCPRCGATGDRAHTIKYCPEYYDYDY